MTAFVIDEATILDNPVNMQTMSVARIDPSRSRTSDAVQVIEFVIGGERFAVDLFDTREVINTPEVTPLPNAPSFIPGMIDLRGLNTMIIDLREMMHITSESTGKKRSRIIILDKRSARR